MGRLRGVRGKNTRTAASEMVVKQQAPAAVFEAYSLLREPSASYFEIVDKLTTEDKRGLFSLILCSSPPLSRTMLEIKFLVHQCNHIEFFKNISVNYGPTVVETCVKSLKYTELQPNTILFEQGERGTKFYIILSGSVDVYNKLPEFNKVIIHNPPPRILTPPPPPVRRGAPPNRQMGEPHRRG